MDFVEKYRGQGGRRSVYDILSLDAKTESGWNAIKENYVATDIHRVTIGGNIFTNYGDFQFAWEKSYVKSPERSADGTVGNLNSHATFATPHLILNFSLMSIDDYRKIMRLDLEQNEFVVECYDPIYNRPFKGKMYFATPQMAKLFKIAKIRFDGEQWEEFVELVGVQEYTVELIGTNADLDLVSVRYLVNAPVGETADSAVDEGEDDVYKGQEIIIGGGTSIPEETFGGKYKFKEWQTADGQIYTDGYAYTINSDLLLYAQWESVNNYTLSFSYGVAEPTMGAGGKPIYSQKVVYGKPIGYLPSFDNYIMGKYEGNSVILYYADGWYRTPTKAENSTPVLPTNPYHLNHDSTIYLLHEPAQYAIFFFNTDLEKVSVKYNESIPDIKPKKEGYTFEGWYEDRELTKKFTLTKMPPKIVYLYAKWVKN